MAQFGLSGLGLYRLPTLSSTTSAKTLFELVAGYTFHNGFTEPSPPSLSKDHHDISISSQAGHYQATYRKMKRLSSVWLIDSVGTPDAALVDIDLEGVQHETEEEALAQRKHDAARERDDNKVRMLTTALHSLLLDDIEAVDEDARMHILRQLVEHLLDTHAEKLPKDDDELLEQLRTAATRKTLQSTDTNTFPNLEVLFALQSVPVIPLAERRGQQEISLGELSTPHVHDEMLSWTLHSYRVREDPDFPKVPIWDERADYERQYLDSISQLSEENSLDFFAHATFMKEMRHFHLKHPNPPWDIIQGWQEESLKQCDNAFEVEILKAKEGEPFRLLAARIEYLLPTFTRLTKEDKVLPYINLEVLQAAEFVELDDSCCRRILRREMRLLLKQDLDVKSIQYECIADLNFNYPNGKLAETSDLPSKMRQAQRARIKAWTNEIEASDHINTRLYTDEVEARSEVDSSYDAPSTPGLPLGLQVAVDQGVIDFIRFEKGLPIWLSRGQDTRSPSEAHHDSYRASDDGKNLDDSQTSGEPDEEESRAGLHTTADDQDDSTASATLCSPGRKRAMGLLDIYNVKKDEEERIKRRKEGLAPMWEGEREVDYPPRRPVYEGGWVRKALFVEVRRERKVEQRVWETGVLDTMGNVEGSGGVMLPGLPVDQDLFGWAGVTVPRKMVGKDPVTSENQVYGEQAY
ncbi:hypothetical protein SNOG_14445 [Parastagonospora nodorum SN15]|uniref:Uncharacterized protein n=1 Tax=Phaeosphaeria nodorum (strain SN15 / ATCC MYA-4574 / FGSC 10173) TaxID=321614 RepID=Q0U1R4_PHANO|nr:hypothetical protein SNOG_14445 [Parastagonospora nodorum SN15]EAT78316.2 hypothetical protein SNOG_14445 [Parastagonospora nodorum SN15]